MTYRNPISDILGRLPHSRVEDIFRALKKEYSAVSLATVYRNLKALESRGIILGFPHPDGSVRYELKKEKPHQHLICKGCGKIHEIKFGFLAQLTQSVRERAGFQIHEEYVSMIGKCVECK